MRILEYIYSNCNKNRTHCYSKRKKKNNNNKCALNQLTVNK